MNIIIDINDFNIENIFYQDSIKNTVINDSKFIRTIYSNEYFIINILFIKFNLKIKLSEKLYNKYKCNFDIKSNEILIKNLINIEKQIINKYDSNKNKEYKMSKQLLTGNIKIFIDDNIILNNNDIILKISGIWETNNNIGLTYKFISNKL